jgi:hypothetical protein
MENKLKDNFSRNNEKELFGDSNSFRDLFNELKNNENKSEFFAYIKDNEVKKNIFESNIEGFSNVNSSDEKYIQILENMPDIRSTYDILMQFDLPVLLSVKGRIIKINDIRVNYKGDLDKYFNILFGFLVSATYGVLLTNLSFSEWKLSFGLMEIKEKYVNYLNFTGLVIFFSVIFILISRYFRKKVIEINRLQTNITILLELLEVIIDLKKGQDTKIDRYNRMMMKKRRLQKLKDIKGKNKSYDFNRRIYEKNI